MKKRINADVVMVKIGGDPDEAPERGALIGEMMDGSWAILLDSGPYVRAFHPSRVSMAVDRRRQGCPDCGEPKPMGHQDCQYPGVAGGM